MNIKKYLILAVLPLLLWGCESDYEFTNTPIDQLIKKYDQEKTFSVILYDMDIDESGSPDKYKHQYKIITVKDSLPTETKTDWYEVEEKFFEYHIENMGMEVASKDEKTGKVSKIAAPPGYSQYVGNQQYGSWQNNGGSSFWVFYGQYAFMRSMFGYHSPISRTGYNTYNSNYRGKAPYHGATSANGVKAYGTGSANARAQNPAAANKSSSFKSKVNNMKTRSASRRSRSSSRYGSSSRGRSSSGGGK